MDVLINRGSITVKAKTIEDAEKKLTHALAAHACIAVDWFDLFEISRKEDSIDVRMDCGCITVDADTIEQATKIIAQALNANDNVNADWFELAELKEGEISI